MQFDSHRRFFLKGIGMTEILPLISLTLALPENQLSTVALKHIEQGHARALYQEDLLDGIEGRLWVEGLGPLLARAHDTYGALIRTGALSRCHPPESRMPLFTFILLTNSPSKSARAAHLTDAVERRGYDHPSNPGPIVWAWPWDDSMIRRLVLHEAFHRWCQDSGGDALSRWTEEGAADLLVYLVEGSIPQLNVTRYFRQSLDSPYGSSFLWWLARIGSKDDRQSLLERLARLHLGLRQDLIYGSLFDNAVSKRPSPPQYPHGDLSGKASNDPAFSIPYWRMPSGEPSLKAPQPNAKLSGHFVWHGPL